MKLICNLAVHDESTHNTVAIDQLRSVSLSINARLRFIKKYLAQKKFYDEHYSYVFMVCRKYLTSDSACRSITNEVLRKILKIDLHSVHHHKSYIHKICVNTCIDHLRARTKCVNHYEINDSFLNVSVEPEIIDKLSYDDILMLINKLPEKQKTVFCLNVIDGYNSTEVGKMLGISSSTCRWLLAKAKDNLKTIISQYYDRS